MDTAIPKASPSIFTIVYTFCLIIIRNASIRFLISMISFFVLRFSDFYLLSADNSLLLFPKEHAIFLISWISE